MAVDEADTTVFTRARTALAVVCMVLGIVLATIGAVLVWSVGVALLVLAGLLLVVALLIGWE